MHSTTFRLEPERSVAEERGAWGAVHLMGTRIRHFEHSDCGVYHTWS